MQEQLAQDIVPKDLLASLAGLGQESSAYFSAGLPLARTFVLDICRPRAFLPDAFPPRNFVLGIPLSGASS